MSSPYQLSLLRRTFTALATAAIAFTACEALAAGNTVKLTGGNKSDECTFSSMSITPSGGVTVQCDGSGNPPPPPAEDPTIPGTFRMANAAMTASPNSMASVSILRTLGSLATTIWWGRSGNGCDPTQGALNWAGGQLSNTLPTPMKASGTCAVTIYIGSPGIAGTPVTTVITVDSAQPPPPQTNPNCPAGYTPPQNLLSSTFAGLGNPLLQMQGSGQIVQIPLPSVSSSGQVTFGESAGGAYTPQPVTLEVSISKCPGYIDTNYTNRCNIRSTNGNYNSITWLAKAFQGRGGTIDASSADANGLCWAGDAGATYYINARWSYQSCAFGAQVCGFAIQYNSGGY